MLCNTVHITDCERVALESQASSMLGDLRRCSVSYVVKNATQPKDTAMLRNNKTPTNTRVVLHRPTIGLTSFIAIEH